MNKKLSSIILVACFVLVIVCAVSSIMRSDSRHKKLKNNFLLTQEVIIQEATKKIKYWSCPIAFVSDWDGDQEIVIIDDDGDNRIQVTFNNSKDIDPSWSSDGNHIIFASNRDGDFEIFVMDIDGSNQTQLTFNNSNELEPKWSPNSENIVFTSDLDGDSEIFIMDKYGHNHIQLTNNDSPDYNPDWSPDGKRLVFESHNNQGDAIMIIEIENSNIMPFVGYFKKYILGSPVWSPDGLQIAYTSNMHGRNSKDFQIDIRTTDEVKEYDIFNLPPPGWNSGYDGEASWSPLGGRIVFVSDKYSNSQIFSIDLSGNNLNRLTNIYLTGNDTSPSFSPKCH